MKHATIKRNKRRVKLSTLNNKKMQCIYGQHFALYQMIAVFSGSNLIWLSPGLIAKKTEKGSESSRYVYTEAYLRR